MINTNLLAAAYMAILVSVAAPSRANLAEDFSGAASGGFRDFLGSTSLSNIGLTGITAFSGSGGGTAIPPYRYPYGPAGSSAWVALNGGPGGVGDAAGVISVAASTVSNGYWFGGLIFEAGALSTTDLSRMSLTLDIDAALNGNYQIRLESGFRPRLLGPENYLFWDGAGSGSYQNAGGLLSSFSEFGAYDPADPVQQIVVAFRDEQATWGAGGTLKVDNISLIPEPASAALLFGGGALLCCLLARRRHLQ